MSTSAPSTQGWFFADAFDRAAPTYDAMVALSPGYHDQLLGAAGALLDRLPAPDGSALKVLDLGCGSGASTQALLEQWRTRGGAADLLSVTGVDMSEGMVAQARAKSWATGVDLVVSDAVTYLEALPDDSVDGILACYLLRNVPDRERLVREMARVLRPGGGVHIDVGLVDDHQVGNLHHALLDGLQVVARIGKLQQHEHVGHAIDGNFALAHAYGFNNHHVITCGFTDQHGFARFLGNAAQCAARRAWANVGALMHRQHFHAGLVTEDGTTRYGR